MTFFFFIYFLFFISSFIYFIFLYIFLSSFFPASYRSLPSQDNLLKNKTEINIKHVTLKSGVTVGNNLGKQKKRLKAATAAISFYYIDSLEWLITLIIMNFCYYMTYNSTSFSMIILYILIGNFVVARTLILRNLRIPDKHLNSIANSLAIENENNANINNNNNGRNIDENNSQIKDSNPAGEQKHFFINCFLFFYHDFRTYSFFWIFIWHHFIRCVLLVLISFIKIFFKSSNSGDLGPRSGICCCFQRTTTLHPSSRR